jgi:hypothetical protein
MTRTPTICKYPDCTAVGKKNWSQVSLCQEHHEAIRLETIKYYANKLPYPQRQHFLRIAHLIQFKVGEKSLDS